MVSGKLGVRLLERAVVLPELLQRNFEVPVLFAIFLCVVYGNQYYADSVEGAYEKGVVPVLAS